MEQIIAMGGGGFSMEPNNLALDAYVLEQARGNAVCFLPQASAEAQNYVVNFYAAFTRLGARPVWLSLFGTVRPDWQAFLLAQDVIYVGGGNTRSMLALWREWGVDAVLRAALANGTVLTGVSAGAICWFEQYLTDSVSPLGVLSGLGFLKGGGCPHYDGEAERRPTLTRKVQDGDIGHTLALDDGAAAHFVDGALQQVVVSRPNARGWRVEPVSGGQARETELPAVVLEPVNPA
jgi:peptidase E